MKKLALIATLLLAPAAWASNNNNAEPMDKEPVLRSFVTHMNTLTKAEQLLELHEQAGYTSYKTQRDVALSEETLKHVPLDSKYNLIAEIFVAYNACKQKPCEPVLVAQDILNSFAATSGAKPEVLHSMMKLFLKDVKPQTQNLLFEHWASYAVAQSRNIELSVALRMKFAKLYPLLVQWPQKEEFMYKLLAEISASK